MSVIHPARFVLRWRMVADIISPPCSSSPLINVIEILRPNPTPGQVRHAVFDFDGTLSLLRAGWQAVMADLMVEVLRATPQAESEAQLYAQTIHPVHVVAGQPTLVQMQWLVDEVVRRAGRPLTAEAYKQAYLARLKQRIRHRANLEAGRVPSEAFRVPGALEFVSTLVARGVICHIASGTDETAVREEAALLGFAPFIAKIRGARDDGSDAKRELIQHLTAEHHLSPGELAVFGDGRAEMEYARSAGGLAIGLATTEDERPGVDEHKRLRLIAAGADVILPDFKPPALLNYFWPTE